jgi:hypothetical protein
MPTPTQTQTPRPTQTHTPTRTQTPTNTLTRTQTPTVTNTISQTPSSPINYCSRSPYNEGVTTSPVSPTGWKWFIWERGDNNHYNYPDGVFDPVTLTLLNFPWSSDTQYNTPGTVNFTTQYMNPSFYDYYGYMEVIIMNCSQNQFYIVDKWLTQYGQPRRYWPSKTLTALPPTTGTYVSGLWATTQPYNAVNPAYNTWSNYPAWPPSNLGPNP